MVNSETLCSNLPTIFTVLLYGIGVSVTGECRQGAQPEGGERLIQRGPKV